jgi:hypothetical protein
LSGNIDTVNFINCEESDDLIVSFSFDEGAEFGIEGFVIHWGIISWIITVVN